MSGTGRAEEPAPASAPTSWLAPAAVVETHISVLTFVGDRAYKLKKPVDLGFLDFSTRARRHRACQREVELNRRLAPDVYLGVLDVVDGDDVVDHLVAMRRMPSSRRLAHLVAAAPEAAGRCVDEVAELVGRFHATAPRSPAIDRAGDPEVVRRNWDDDVAAMSPFVGDVLGREAFDRVAERARRYLDGRRHLFEARMADGFIVDGHGDLQAGDVFWLDDGPRILDCIEFSDELRHGDVLADVGFLAMDLERLGAPALADRLLERWALAAGARGEDVPPSLLHHYVAYRAHVRAKVACLRWAQEAPEDPARGLAADEARQLLALCDRHLDAGRVRLVLVGGAPGTGKSTVAAGLGASTGWPVLRSDVVRKRLAGLDPLDRSGAGPPGAGIYGDELGEATYRALLDAAEALLDMGTSVVLDAAWLQAPRRAAARQLADRTSADLVELRCDLPGDTAGERIRRRAAAGTDPSDADDAVAATLAASADPWPEATVLDTSPPPAVVVADASAHAGPS